MNKDQATPQPANALPALGAVAGDPRAELVRQVLASRTFAKSIRLSQFFEFICRKTLEGHTDEVNEQQIGIHVFGRSTAYNATDDSIVRTQARLLRQRLEEYFEHECPACPIVVLVPKGGYVPVFERRPQPSASTATHFSNAAESTAWPQEQEPNPSPSPAQARIPSEAPRTGSPAEQPSAQNKPVSLGSKRSIPEPASRWPSRPVTVGLAALLLLTAGLLLHYRSSFDRPLAPTLWHSIFASGRPVVIVPSDDGLVLFEELRHAPVTLDEYLSGSYLRQAPGEPLGGPATADWLSSHQYTSTADLSLALRLDRLPEAAAANVTTRYARVLRLDDLKGSNVILIGGVGANPWVELFSHELNFDVNYDWKTAEGYVIDKKPQPGEQAKYSESRSANSPTSYGVLAYLPGVTGTGSTLLFDGSGMAGTEAAADFPFSGDRFASFLQQLGPGPGGSIPFFEVLLETRSLGGNAPEAQVIGWRRVQH